MVSFTTTFVAIIGFVSLAQPIAAAPLAMVAASAVGGLVSGHKIRSDSPIWARDDALTTQFKACVSKMHTSQKPTVKKSGKIVNISNLPAECIANVKSYNARPDIKALQGKQGKATITGPNSVRLDGMPANVVDLLDG